MFEGKNGLQSQFLEFSLNRISEILQEPKQDPFLKDLQKAINHTLENIFQGLAPDKLQLQLLPSQKLNKPTLFLVLKKVLSIIEDIKRYAKSLEELACYKNGKNTDYIWLEDSLYHLEQVMVHIYSLLQTLAQNFRINEGWCFDDACDQKHSYAEFQKDIFCYVYIHLNKAKEAIKEILRKNPIQLKFIKGTIEIQENGLISKELKIKIEQNCIQFGKNKKKKKKKNKLTKNEQRVIPIGWKIEKVIEEDQKNITTFLNNLVIKQNQRERCPVSEEWLKRFSYSNFLKK